jgi:hypothetical protein
MDRVLKAVLWAMAHVSEITTALGLAATALAAAGRAIPAERYAALEARAPRLAAAFRLCRAVGFDVVKAARAAWAIAGPTLRPLLLSALHGLAVARGLRAPGDRDAMPPPHPRRGQDPQ